MASCHSSKNVTSSSKYSMSKKQKNEVTEVEETLDDRLSRLPDEVLVQILSLLPTKDAVSSCVLSKRWRRIWTSIDNFIFINRNYSKVKNFISFVDHVITQSTCSKIKKFQFDFDRSNREFNSKISLWLSFAVQNKVEDVVLHSFDDNLTYELPLCMYTCSSLITLKLSGWVFDEGTGIAWSSLKSLTLHLTELEDSNIAKLLSSCPALETMELSFCEGCRHLEITSSNLKRLTLTNLSVAVDDYLEIFAPNLQHLDISGNLGHIEIRLVNVSSLVIASLTFRLSCINEEWEEDDIEEDSCYDYHQGIRNLILVHLQKLSYVTELTIGTWFTESDNSLCCFELRYLAKGDNIDLQSLISSFVLPNLKKIKIVISFEVLLQFTRPLHLDFCLKDHSEWGFEKLFKLSEFLLKAATVLEKFVIVSKGIKCKTCSTNCASLYLSRLSEKLLGCPRSSADSVIIFQE